MCACTWIGIYLPASHDIFSMAESRAEEEASSLMTLPIKALIPFMKALPLRPHLISVTSQRANS